jgi:hypothetical protein
LKVNLKEPHCDTTKVIEVEPQAVLNSLTEHDSRMHLKIAEALGKMHTRGDYFEGDGGQ